MSAYGPQTDHLRRVGKVVVIGTGRMGRSSARESRQWCRRVYELPRAGTLKEVTRFRLVQRLHTLCKLGTQSISASSCEARARQSCTKLNTTAAEMKDQHGGSDA